MNDLDIIDRNTGTAVATTGADPFAAYGATLQGGTFLSFSRVGEFEAGQDKEQVPFGTRLVANMLGFRQGWRCWIGGKMIDDRTDFLGMPQPRRNELGDMDQGMWERDAEGKPRDPWVMTDILEMSDGKTDYIFAATSKGGRNALQKLCAAYAKERRMRPDMLPIITLGRDSYVHPIYRKTYVPVFKIVGWTDQNNPSVDDAPRETVREEEQRLGQPAANFTQGEAVAASQTSMTEFPSSTGRSAPRQF